MLFEGLEAFVVFAAVFKDFVEALFEEVDVVHEFLVRLPSEGSFARCSGPFIDLL